MSKNKPLILSIDDDEKTLECLKELLNPQGYNVIECKDPDKLIPLLKKYKPDLLLMDVWLGKVSGYKLCASLQENPEFSYIPVIFLTDLEEEKNKAKALAVGAVDFITKSTYNKEKLLATINKHLKTKTRWLKIQKILPPDKHLYHPDFLRFKEFLCSHLKEIDKNQLAKYSPLEIYKICDEFDIPPRKLSQYIAKFLSIPFISHINPKNVALGLLPLPFCKANYVIPINEEDKTTFILSNPFNWHLMDFLKNYEENKPKSFYITDPLTITNLLTYSETNIINIKNLKSSNANLKKDDDIYKIYENAIEKYNIIDDDEEEKEETTLIEGEEAKPIIALVNKIIEDAYKIGASDIHIEPREKEVIVRYRIDGVLKIVHRFNNPKIIKPIIARIKVMSKLNIAEKRLPQDGRINFKRYSLNKIDIDLRVSIAPIYFGEKVVMRILDKKKSVWPLDKLGFSERHLRIYREKIRSPYGMILHVGPTGSGKSMTLYAALNEINSPEINIQTAEDPIEYTLEGINQLQVQPTIGLTFEKALRCFLRQDPDVILVGEIRDFETAKIAVEASLTGHLLFSTLHTNDASSTITRLIEIGIEPFMVSSSLILICAQRLVRRLCNKCKVKYKLNAQEREILGGSNEEDIVIYKAKGCEECNNIGYKGRIGIHEILVPNEHIRIIINEEGINSEVIKKIAIEECDMTTLYWDAIEKVRQGITSINEVLKRIKREEFDSRPKWMRKGKDNQNKDKKVKFITKKYWPIDFSFIEKEKKEENNR